MTLSDPLNLVLIIFALIGGFLSIIEVGRHWKEFQEKRIDTFGSIEKNALKLIYKINADQFDPDLVVGIGRSGAFLGGWLAGNLGSKPIQVVERSFQTDRGRPVSYPNGEVALSSIRDLFGEHAKVLIVEGASTTGASLAEFSELQRQIAPDWQCQYAVLYEVTSSKFPCDYVALKIKRPPKRYPWHKTVQYQKHLRREASVYTVSAR